MNISYEGNEGDTRRTNQRIGEVMIEMGVHHQGGSGKRVY